MSTGPTPVTTTQDAFAILSGPARGDIKAVSEVAAAAIQKDKSTLTPAALQSYVATVTNSELLKLMRGFESATDDAMMKKEYQATFWAVSMEVVKRKDIIIAEAGATVPKAILAKIFFDARLDHINQSIDFIECNGLASRLGVAVSRALATPMRVSLRDKLSREPLEKIISRLQGIDFATLGSRNVLFSLIAETEKNRS